MRHLVKMGDSHGAAQLRKTVRKGCGTRDHHRLWFNWDPCGMFCASFVWAVEITSFFGMLNKVIIPYFGMGFWGLFHASVLATIAVLALTSHARAMLSNPGAVPAHAKPVNPEHWSKHCHRCNHFKPARAHHCSVCGRCVIKMDHHCPWVNTCVGMANHKFFMLFVMYIASTCIYSLVLIFFYFLHCMSPTATCPSEPGDAIPIMIMTITGVLFGLFTGCLFVDQVNNILTNTTQIDRLKGHEAPNNREADERKQFWDNLSEVFGGDPYKEGVRWTWFVPTGIKFKDPEALTGYCFRDVPRPRTQAEMEMV